MLGPNLHELFIHCQMAYTFSTVAIIAVKIVDFVLIEIEMLELLHEIGFLHKNIAPEHFVFGIGEKSQQLLGTNLAFSTPFKDPFSKNHIPYSEDRFLMHFNVYTSVNVLAGTGKLR